MTIAETALIYAGIPVLATVVIATASVFTAKKRPRPAEYRVGQPWNREPLLWTAADEVVPAAAHASAHGHGAHAAAIEAGPADLIGGSASGRF